jgi:PEP-CTERM motif-containing protein
MRFIDMRLIKGTVLAGLIGLCAAPASAAVIYKFDQDNCSSGCGLSNYGTVTLTDIAGGGVNVKIDLLGGSGLIDSGALTFHALAFKLAGAPVVDITGLPSPWSYAGPSNYTPGGGFGTFNYILDCNAACAPNNPWTSGLDFDVTTTSITTASFIDGGSASDTYFVADISNPNDGHALTGRIGASYSGHGTEIPEPFTLSLFGMGVAGVAAIRRRRKTA